MEFKSRFAVVLYENSCKNIHIIHITQYENINWFLNVYAWSLVICASGKTLVLREFPISWCTDFSILLLSLYEWWCSNHRWCYRSMWYLWTSFLLLCRRWMDGTRFIDGTELLLLLLSPPLLRLWILNEDNISFRQCVQCSHNLVSFTVSLYCSRSFWMLFVIHYQYPYVTYIYTHPHTQKCVEIWPNTNVEWLIAWLVGLVIVWFFSVLISHLMSSTI